MTVSMLLVVGVVVLVGVLGLAMMAGSGRGSGLLVMGLLAVAALGGVAWFALAPAPVAPAPGPTPTPVTPTPREPGKDATFVPGTGGAPSEDGEGGAELRDLRVRVFSVAEMPDPTGHVVSGDAIDADSIQFEVEVDLDDPEAAFDEAPDFDEVDVDHSDVESGTPVAGAEVEVYEGLPLPGASPLAHGVTAEDGTVTLKDVPRRRLLVRARKAGHAAAAGWSAGKSMKEIALALLPAGMVEGKVLSAVNGDPLPGAVVTAGDAVSVACATDGSFRLEEVGIGGTSVKATAPGHASQTVNVTIAAAGAVETHEFRLQLAAVLAGVVYGPDGNPVKGAQVSLQGMREVPIAGLIPQDILSAVSGEAGAFRFEAAPVARKLRLSALTTTALSETIDLEPLTAGETRDGLEIRLVAGAFIDVTAQEPEGKPIKGVNVTATPETDKPEAVGMMRRLMARTVGSGGSRTDDDGKARLGPLAAGSYVVTAKERDRLPAEAKIELADGAAMPLKLVLEAGVAIRGLVIDDLGQPLAGAEVTAQRFSMGPGGFVRETRKSGEDGTFLVGGLEAKPLNLSVAKEGYVRTSLSGVKPGDDPVTVTLQRGGAIVGVAVDEAGEPVTRFEVLTERTDEKTAANPMDPESFRAVMGMGDSVEDGAGQFRVAGLAPGVYKVTLKSDVLAPGRLEDVRVVAAEETAVRIVLPEGLSIEGTVVSAADGTPIRGAKVAVQRGGVFGQFDMDFEFPEEDEANADVSEGMRAGVAAMFGGDGTVTTDDSGRFTLKGLEEGTINVKAGARDFAPALVKSVKVPAQGALRVELKAGGIVTGKVTNADGTPAKGMMVMLQKLPAIMKMSTTGEDGTYRVSGLAGGSYLFYVMENPAAMMGGGGFNLRSESVRVEEGKTVVKDHVMGSGIKVTGKVTRGSEPVSGAMIMLMPGSGNAGPMGMPTGPGAGFAMGSTKEDGTYEITGVKPGRYSVMIQSGMIGGGGGGESVVVPEGATVVRKDIALPVDSLQGQVVDENGEPVSGAQVMAVKPGTNMSSASDLGSIMENMGGQTFSDDDGRFALENIKAGVYSLRVSATGHGTAVVEPVTAGPGGGDVRVVLSRGQAVKIKVVDPDGKPVSGAGIYMKDVTGRDLSTIDAFDAVRTGADGTATVQAPPGDIVFEAVVRGFAPGSSGATVPASSEVTIRLVRGGKVRVRVLDAGGSPLAGAGVAFLDAGGEPVQMRLAMENMAELLGGAGTDDGGIVERGDLPPGSYRVRAAAGDRSAEEAVRVVAGETVEVTVRIP